MAHFIKQIAAVCLIAFALATPVSAQQDCFARRVTFDIGSGQTRMMIARINHCQALEKQLTTTAGNTIRWLAGNLEVVELSDACTKVNVDYEADIANNHRRFHSDTMHTGASAITDLLACAKQEEKKYRELHPRAPAMKTTTSAVATAAFRSFLAKDKAIAVAYFKRLLDLGIDQFAVVPQEIEAYMGFVSALQAEEMEPVSVAVSDIGGASWQLVGADADGLVQLLGTGSIASRAFLRAVVADIKPEGWQHASDNPRANPNPMSTDEKLRAIAAMHSIATINGEFAVAHEWFAEQDDVTVLGVGGVHKYPLRKFIESTLNRASTTYTRNEALATLILAGDFDGDGDFDDVQMTNMAMVIGLMQAWGVEAIKQTSVNNAYALQLNPDLMDWGIAPQDIYRK